ncbi:MAG TPA: hypothetical protein DCP28_19240 [Cytophagales bacterium]|nr:hypothetical protein [Cytophagales bacterium]
MLTLLPPQNYLSPMKTRRYFTLLLCSLLGFAHAQLPNQQEITLTAAYADISPLGQYLYDSASYEEARAQTDFEYLTFTYPSDTLQVEGYICKPRNVDTDRLPVIIYNRGGTGNYGKLTEEGFPYFSELAREGYLVVGSNYRFVGEYGKYDEAGGVEVNDVLNLYTFAQALPYADPERMFMLGISRGGLMTYLAVKQLNLKAAAVIGGVTNVRAGYEDRPIFLTGWDDLSEEENYLGLQNILPDFAERKDEYFDARSPVLWAEEIQCPILILHSRQDGRVRVNQALDMAHALYTAEKPFQLKIYDRKSHGLPSQYFDSAEEVLTWFEEHGTE